MSLASCGADCTLLGCPHAVTVLLGLVDAPAGEYSVTGTADSDPFVCTFVLPQDDARVACEPQGVFIDLDSESGSPPYQRLGRLSLYTQPRQLSVQIARPDRSVTAKRFWLFYERFVIDNGGGECDANCARASVSMFD